MCSQLHFQLVCHNQMYVNDLMHLAYVHLVPSPKDSGPDCFKFMFLYSQKAHNDVEKVKANKNK